MAIDEEIFITARVMYECGLSLRTIAKYLNISKSTVHTHAIKERWERKHDDYIKAASSLNPTEKFLTDAIIHSKAIQKEYLFNLTLKIALQVGKKALEILEKGTKERMVKINKNGEDVFHPITEELSPKDLKDLKDVIESLDKASVTLGINPRFSNAPIISPENITIKPFEKKEEE